MSNLEIKYAITEYNDNEYWKQLAFYEPEPVIKAIIKERDKDVKYLKCPAFQDYYKNCFLIRSPVDLTLTIEQNGEHKYIATKQYTQEFFDKNIFSRLDTNSKYSMLSIQFYYTFISNESVILEQLAPSMHKTKTLNNINIIQGMYDISKWIRPVELAIEIIDDTKPIVIKRGDPLYYVRFVTDKNVTLTRIVDFNKDINQVIKSCAAFKKFVPGNTLEKNYEIAASYINLIKDKLFNKKSKCPFGFLRRKDE